MIIPRVFPGEKGAGEGMKLDKNILIQYADMKAEIEDLRRRIRKTEDEIERLEAETVIDTVNGGYGGIQHFRIQGYPKANIERKKRILEERKEKLGRAEVKLMILTNEAYDYIESLENSELRIMFRLYYIDDLTWYRVAIKMNEFFPKRRIKYTEDNCRKRNERFFKEN
jgi:hypothetical protein